MIHLHYIPMAEPATPAPSTTLSKIIHSLLFVVAGLSLYVMSRYNYEHRDVRSGLYLLATFSLIQLADLWILRPCSQRFGIPRLFYAILKMVIYFITCFTILRSLYGFDIIPLLTTSAVISFVLGLALQDTLGNFFAGITIHLEKPYRVGDWIKARDAEGKVAEINWRTTKLLTNDGNYIIIPNNSIAKENIINFNSPYAMSACWIHVDLCYQIPPNQVKSVILEALSKVPSIPQGHLPEVQLREFKDSAIGYGIKVWIEDWDKKNLKTHEVRTHLWYAFKRHHFTIPYPIRNVYLHPPAAPSGLVTLEDKVEILRDLSLFSGQSGETIQAIASALVEQQYAAEDLFFHEGDPGDSLYIVSSGQVAIIKQKVKIAELSRGSFFGEMSLLTGEHRSATVQAMTDCVCLTLSKSAFSSLVSQNHEILERISEIMGARHLQGLQVLEKARLDEAARNLDAKNKDSFKNQLLGLMRSFLD